MKTFEQFIREQKAKSIDWLGEEKMQKYHISLAEAVELVDMWQKLQQTPVMRGGTPEPFCSCSERSGLYKSYDGYSYCQSCGNVVQEQNSA